MAGMAAFLNPQAIAAVAGAVRPDPGTAGMAASQAGLASVQRFGLFGEAAQNSAARQTEAVMPSAGELAALNLDELTGFGEVFAGRLADSVILPILGQVRPAFPPWLLVAGVILLLFFLMKKGKR